MHVATVKNVKLSDIAQIIKLLLLREMSRRETLHCEISAHKIMVSRPYYWTVATTEWRSYVATCTIAIHTMSTCKLSYV